MQVRNLILKNTEQCSEQPQAYYLELVKSSCFFFAGVVNFKTYKTSAKLDSPGSVIVHLEVWTPPQRIQILVEVVHRIINKNYIEVTMEFPIRYNTQLHFLVTIIICFDHLKHSVIITLLSLFVDLLLSMMKQSLPWIFETNMQNCTFRGIFA